MQFDDVNIGGQLNVGSGIAPAIKQGAQKINGSMFAEGPVVFGQPDVYANNMATVMIGPTTNDEAWEVNGMAFTYLHRRLR